MIMPVYNAVEYIKQSLPPLIAMMNDEQICEVIVVDDTSSDETPDVARALGANVMPSGGRLGPGGARNVAAKVAKGDILWFVDADVVVHSDAAEIMQSGFAEGEDVVAVFGSYDDRPPAQNFLSQYKNLVHHYYHQNAKADASTFWAGCGAVRKSEFLQQNGFDIETYKHPSIEDIELGYRLIRAGGRIKMLVNMRCTHLKEWRLVNLLHTEIFRRAIPWSRLMLNASGMVNDLNVSNKERFRAVIGCIFLFSLLAFVLGMISFPLIILISAVCIFINKEIMTVFFRRKGLLFALGGFLFHQFYYTYSLASYAYAVFERMVVKK